jgi:hypothetical protein
MSGKDGQSNTKSDSCRLRKFEGFQSSAPERADCGLAVDIDHIPDMSTGNVLAPTECLVNGTPHIPLFQKSYLQFRSRIINGSFIRGFCIRIIRGKASLQIVNVEAVSRRFVSYELLPFVIYYVMTLHSWKRTLHG